MVCSVSAPKESLSSQPKAQVRIDEVKNPADIKPKFVVTLEKKPRSWQPCCARSRGDVPGCASRMDSGPTKAPPAHHGERAGNVAGRPTLTSSARRCKELASSAASLLQECATAIGALGHVAQWIVSWYTCPLAPLGPTTTRCGSRQSALARRCPRAPRANHGLHRRKTSSRRSRSSGARYMKSSEEPSG